METHTIVGVFDNDVQAQRAVDRLVEWGFTRDNVHLADATTTTSDSSATASRSTNIPPHADTLHTRIGTVLSSLFGSKVAHEDVTYYSEAVRRGGVVITVTSGSEEGADSAADILNEYGAIDIDVHARYLRDSGWQGSPAASSTGSGDRDETVTPVIEGGLQDGKRRRDKGGVRIYSDTAEAPPK